MGGIGRLISCLGAEIFLLADSAIIETRKLVSDEQKSGITASNDGIKKERSHCFLSHSVCVAVAGGEERQLAAVGEEEVHSMLDFCHRGQWRGWGDLAVVEQGGRGHHPGERPARMHQQQPHAAVISASHCLFCCYWRWHRDMMDCLFVHFLCALFMCDIF